MALEARTWVVKTNDTTHEVLADSYTKDEINHTTKFFRGGELVAEFNWWDSIIEKNPGA